MLRRRRYKEPLPKDISVLIVDDEPDIREVVRSELGDFGFVDIHEAASGEQALNLVHRVRPGLIILDYMMPGMSGETVAPFFRTLAPRAAIVVFSGVLRFHPDWADDFVDKLDLEDLPRVGLEAVRSIRRVGRFSR